jgi:hypothetical protein
MIQKQKDNLIGGLEGVSLKIKSMKKIKEILMLGFLSLVGLWLVCALSFDFYMIYTAQTNPEKTREIVNQLNWKLDGTFKNNPDNIWYTASKK